MRYFRCFVNCHPVWPRMHRAELWSEYEHNVTKPQNKHHPPPFVGIKLRWVLINLSSLVLTSTSGDSEVAIFCSEWQNSELSPVSAAVNRTAPLSSPGTYPWSDCASVFTIEFCSDSAQSISISTTIARGRASPPLPNSLRNSLSKHVQVVWIYAGFRVHSAPSRRQ